MEVIQCWELKRTDTGTGCNGTVRNSGVASEPETAKGGRYRDG